MERRGFLQAILASAMAPAVARAASLMPVRQLSEHIVGLDWGDDYEILAGRADASDPLGQYGYVKTRHRILRVNRNDYWMLDFEKGS